jgi:PAS domain-containing protein
MRDQAKQFPLRVSLIYALFGLLWIGITDWLTSWSTQDARQILRLETGKGCLFVGISAALWFWFVHRQFRHLDQTAAKLQDVNAELRQQRDLLDSFINSLPGVVYVVDSQKRLLRWNRRFEEVTGRTGAELKDFDTRQLFPAVESPVLQAGMERALSEGTATV